MTAFRHGRRDAARHVHLCEIPPTASRRRATWPGWPSRWLQLMTSSGASNASALSHLLTCPGLSENGKQYSWRELNVIRQVFKNNVISMSSRACVRPSTVYTNRTPQTPFTMRLRPVKCTPRLRPRARELACTQHATRVAHQRSVASDRMAECCSAWMRRGHTVRSSPESDGAFTVQDGNLPSGNLTVI